MAGARWPADTVPTQAVAAGSDIIGSTDALQRAFVPLLEKHS